jgi:hypothetical protein
MPSRSYLITALPRAASYPEAVRTQFDTSMRRPCHPSKTTILMRNLGIDGEKPKKIEIMLGWHLLCRRACL